MVAILQQVSFVSLLIQLISTLFYFTMQFLHWYFPDPKSRIRWINERDRFILILSICFFVCSYLMVDKIGFVDNLYINYLFSILILAMTLMVLVFHYRKFKIFQKNLRVRINSKNRNPVENKFKLKKISESDLDSLIYRSYSNYFSSDFEDFKCIFIDNQDKGRKLNCVNVERSKEVGYSKIFELMDEISEDGILNLYRNERKKLIHFITKNFQKGDEIIVEKNLNVGYSKWVRKNR